MRHARRDGFTLVELLVVIGIIGLLISILLPALNRARAEAKRAVCLSNLRTLGQCYLEYVNESKGHGVFNLNVYNSTGLPPGASLYTEYWFAGATNYSGTTKWDVKQGYLAKFFRNPAFLMCPSATDEIKSFSATSSDDAAAAAFATAPPTTYGYNGNVAQNVKKVSQIKNSSETCALVDAVDLASDGTMTGCLRSFGPYPSGGDIYYKHPSLHGRHAGRGNVLWYDGHATSEAPYITTLDANIDGRYPGWSSATGKQSIRKGKIGYLTPSTVPEVQLFDNFPKKNSLSYYYWANKTTRE